MKTSQLVACVLILSVTLPRVSAASFGQPRCSTMTPEIWNKNQTACLGVFAVAIKAKKITKETASSMCACVADELVNKMNCSEIKRYDDDLPFQKAQTDRIQKLCSTKGLPPRK